jgi:uncharacterized membrane protein
MERPIRSIMKAISWRIIATLTTMSLVYVFSGNLVLGTLVGAGELFFKTIVYYVHERIWNWSSFGRQKK